MAIADSIKLYYDQIWQSFDIDTNLMLNYHTDKKSHAPEVEKALKHYLWEAGTPPHKLINWPAKLQLADHTVVIPSSQRLKTVMTNMAAIQSSQVKLHEDIIKLNDKLRLLDTHKATPIVSQKKALLTQQGLPSVPEIP